MDDTRPVTRSGAPTSSLVLPPSSRGLYTSNVGSTLSVRVCSFCLQVGTVTVEPVVVKRDTLEKTEVFEVGTCSVFVKSWLLVTRMVYRQRVVSQVGWSRDFRRRMCICSKKGGRERRTE